MKRILVGLDGSPRSPGVLVAAIDLAHRFDAKLTLARSVGIPAGFPQEMWKLEVPSLADYLRNEATAYLAKCAAGVPADVLHATEPTRVDIGVPWDGICHAAQEMHADLLVVGSHGYGGVDRILGTTAAKVVNHAPCSVFVVREGAKPA